MPVAGAVCPPDVRAKLSAANRGRKRTPEARARMSAARRAGTEAHNPDLSYTAIHKRLRNDRGTPSLCEHCGITTARKFEWAFAGEGHKNGGLSTDLSKYIRLCTSCHIEFDGHPRWKGGEANVNH